MENDNNILTKDQEALGFSTREDDHIIQVLENNRPTGLRYAISGFLSKHEIRKDINNLIRKQRATYGRRLGVQS